MTVITRIAPSPTGSLHLGTARTALFNWLFARHHGGKFLLRIEDTDQARSSSAAVDVILEGLNWLGLEHDGATIFQSANQKRHQDVAATLFDSGHAYYCTCSPEEVEAMREKARLEKATPKYDGRCRDAGHTQGVLRFKMPQLGVTCFQDTVQGEITINNCLFDDFIILRADQTPTYMLAVVVDDHDMNVTHIIRGDDHINNTFKQLHLYQALNWALPNFAHVPLIHGEDGAKFSKRHGAPALTSYQEQGYLPEALFTYLLRLGWSCGDQELFTTAEAIALFRLEGLNKAAARFDLKKLLSINAHFMRLYEPKNLLNLITPWLQPRLNRALSSSEEKRLLTGLPGLANRSETLKELADQALMYCDVTLQIDAEVKQEFLTQQTTNLLQNYAAALNKLATWTHDSLETSTKTFLGQQALKMPQLGKPLRLALTGQLNAPGIYDLLMVFEKQETLNRIEAFCSLLPAEEN